MHAALIGIGLKTGDEVIVPSMTFIRAVTPLSHLGVTPVIADIDSETGNIDPESIIKNITTKTKAVVVVHMWGIPADCDAIRKICDEHNIIMIEDFSQAHFAKYNDSFVGSYGDVSFASLQRKKLLSVGEGGIITTNNQALYKHLQDITSPGSFNERVAGIDLDFSGYGLNMRMNPFGAAIIEPLLGQVPGLINDRQASINQIEKILSKLPNLFELPKIPSYATSVSWYAYKPRLLEGSLEELKSGSPWKFSSFGYPAIAEHEYWSKSDAYYPFSLGMKPEVRHSLDGHTKYMDGRITVNIPTINASYWTEEKISEWTDSLI